MKHLFIITNNPTNARFLYVSCFLAATFILLGGCKSPTPNTASRGRVGPLNVMDFGAIGDGLADDTAAIQAAINSASERGGGKVFFPFTKTGYRIASPAHETVEGRPCRGQLYIPYNPKASNIQLEGEMPCALLNAYAVRPGMTFEDKPRNNTFLFSTWEAPEVRDPEERPYALLASVQGTNFKGKFSVRQFSIWNLEFRTFLNTDKMYTTSGAVNLQNVARVNIQDSQFGLDKNIGDFALKKELQASPVHTFGLMTSGDQNDDNVLRNVCVQGFRYGFVFGEMVVADYLIVANCEEGVVFHDSTHLSTINHLVAQHNAKILTSTRERLFGHEKAACYVDINRLDFEPGAEKNGPQAMLMKYGIFDPENRIRGRVRWHCGWPIGKAYFPIEGGQHVKAERIE